jgi:prepilin-type N-terminal cleavage/methylation domain-containing protein
MTVNMKKMRLGSKLSKAWQGRSPGFTLIEVLIALALFAIIGIVFAGGLTTASKAVLTADVRTRAESLARSQMEFVKNSDYIDYSKALDDPKRQPDFYEEMTKPGEAADYIIETIAEPIDPADYQPYDLEDEDIPGVYAEDDGIQLITVTVSHDGRQVITLVGYKVDR